MGYIRAEDILPAELLAAVQEYIDGGMLYIPRRNEHRTAWGARSGSREQYSDRNGSISAEYRSGSSTRQLAEKYFLSEKTIQRIVRTTVPPDCAMRGGNVQ